MGTEQIQLHITNAAEAIREFVASQRDSWRLIPYWTLESEGRGGWNDNWGLPYKYGLLGIDKLWPHQLFVELSTGRLVCNGTDEVIDASDGLVVSTYTNSADLFTAVDHLEQRVNKTANGRDTFNKETNDHQRDVLRSRYQVPTVWLEPAKPIHYTY